MEDVSCSGVILAGGLGKRFSGRAKGLIEVAGRRILDRIFDCFQTLFSEIVLVTNDPVQYLEWNCLIVSDLMPERSSLTGVHAGLYYASNPYAFIAACDTPFLRSDLAARILAEVDPRLDAIIPWTKAGPEPLCAVYSQRCLQPIEHQLQKENYKIQTLFGQVRTKRISEEALRAFDPDLISFFNVNTPEDLHTAETLAAADTRSSNGR